MTSGHHQSGLPEVTSRPINPTRRCADVPRAHGSIGSRALGRGVFALLAILSMVYPPITDADVNYVYDESGRLKTVTDPGGNIAQYNYDAVGNLTEIKRIAFGQLAITEFTPNAGPVGTSVTIYGSGFASTINGNTVKFNGKTATVTFASVTKLVATVPSAATTGTISVKVGTTTVTSQDVFTVSASVVTAAPTITGFTPTIGVAGTAVTITGTNFDTTPKATKVQLNQTLATATISSTTSIAMTVPAFAASGKIKVTTPLGIAVSAADFIVPPGGIAATDIVASTRLTVNGPALPLAVNTQNKYGLVLFDGLPGDDLAISITNFSTVPANTAIAYAIYKPDNTLWVTGNVTSANPFILIPKIQVTGTHVLRLASGTATFSMSLALQRNAVETLIADGAPTVVTATQPNAVRRYQFMASAGQMYGLALTNLTHTPANTGSTSLYVYPQSGYTLGNCFASSATGGCAITIGPFMFTGTYTVELTPPSGSAVGGTLTLSTDLQGSLSFNTPTTIQISRPGQNANWTFSGTAGQRVSVAMSGSTFGGGVYVSIKKPDGTFLTSSTFLSGATGFVDTQTLPTSGTYVLFVDPAGINTGAAQFTLHDVPADVTGPIVPGGPPVTMTTTVPGQNVSLTFTGAANQRVSLAITNATYPYSGGYPYVYLKKPDGTTLASTYFTSSGYIDVQTLPVAGTYTVFVDPSGSAVGSATLQLYDVVPDITGTIVPGGPPVTVTTTAPGQNASLTFTGAANQRVSLAVSGSTIPGYNNSVSLKKPDGTTLAYAGLIGTSTFIDVQTLPVAGTYTVFLDPGNSEVGSATLQLYDVPADATGSLTIGGAAVPVTISVPGQNGRLIFTGTAGQQVTVHVTGNTMSYVVVSLLRPDGTTLSSFSLFSASGNMTQQTLATTGTYTVVIDPQQDRVGSLDVAVTSP